MRLRLRAAIVVLVLGDVVVGLVAQLVALALLAARRAAVARGLALEGADLVLLGTQLARLLRGEAPVLLALLDAGVLAGGLGGRRGVRERGRGQRGGGEESGEWVGHGSDG